jgi:hypothetical protein
MKAAARASERQRPHNRGLTGVARVAPRQSSLGYPLVKQ